MTEKAGPGQADKRAAEERTAQVAADNKAEQRRRSEQESQQAGSAAEKVQRSIESGDTDDVETTVVVDPFPAYEDKSVAELRSQAESRGVEINRDVEKAHLVSKLRRQDPTNPSYDLTPLEQLRSAAKEKGVELDEEFEKAHLLTELRAADTHTG